MESRKRRDAELKAAVVLEALKGGKTLKQLAADHGVHPVQVSAWKKLFRAGMKRIFSESGAAGTREKIAELNGKLESLRSEHAWMRGKLAALEPQARRSLLEPSGADISLRKQCSLLGIARSSLYYRKKSERPENLALMETIKEMVGRFPGYGVLRVTRALREQGKVVNPKRVRRLLRKLGMVVVFIQSLPVMSFFRGIHPHHFSRIR